MNVVKEGTVWIQITGGDNIYALVWLRAKNEFYFVVGPSPMHTRESYPDHIETKLLDVCCIHEAKFQFFESVMDHMNLNEPCECL